MSSIKHFLLKQLTPIILVCVIVLDVVVAMLFTLPVWVALIIAAALFGGFYTGLLNSRSTRFRQARVKKQQEYLQELGDQIRIQTAAMESAANGIIITDTGGNVQWVNPGFCKLTGYTAEEVMGKNLSFLNSGVHAPDFFKQMWVQILAGQVWHDEVVNKRKDGELYTEEMTITPVFDQQNEIKSFVAIKQDISERKRLEEISSREKKRMETELDVARDIQMNLLRKNITDSSPHEDIDIYAYLIPAREVGGDFYDYFWLDDENLCFFIGDVSGKGVPAALMMAVTKTLLKSSIRSTKSVSSTLKQVNNEISKDNDNYMFITVFIGILNSTTGYLSYASAGHNPTYLVDRTDNDIITLNELHGIVIGAMEDSTYRESVRRIKRGDSLFIYTDGITEARNHENALFGDSRLHDFLLDHLQDKPEQLVNSLLTEVKRHEEGTDQADDITILNIHYIEPSEAALVDSLYSNVPNNLESVQIFIQDFGRFATKQAVESETVQQLQIVFDELLSNIIKYAYTDNDPHEIEVKVRFYGDNLTITILDDGQQYNPFNNQKPDTTLEIQDREIGGLGIHLVKFFVDEYEYHYKEQIKKNSIHLTKQLNAELNEN